MIAPFYQRLRAKGKPTQVALVACLHKLLTIFNALLKYQRDWQAPQLVAPQRVPRLARSA